MHRAHSTPTQAACKPVPDNLLHARITQTLASSGRRRAIKQDPGYPRTPFNIVLTTPARAAAAGSFGRLGWRRHCSQVDADCFFGIHQQPVIPWSKVDAAQHDSTRLNTGPRVAESQCQSQQRQQAAQHTATSNRFSPQAHDTTALHSCSPAYAASPNLQPDAAAQASTSKHASKQGSHSSGRGQMRQHKHARRGRCGKAQASRRRLCKDAARKPPPQQQQQQNSRGMCDSREARVPMALHVHHHLAAGRIKDTHGAQGVARDSYQCAAAVPGDVLCACQEEHQAGSRQASMPQKVG